jgi:hypothetical protein
MGVQPFLSLREHGLQDLEKGAWEEYLDLRGEERQERNRRINKYVQ